MLPSNKIKFEHRIKTIIGQLRHVLKDVEKDPSTAYGNLHTAERSVVQAMMFIVKDLIDQIGKEGEGNKVESKALKELYDCLGFHKDELPAKYNTRE